MTVGERIKATRKEKGLAQREITGPGVSHAYISRIEAELRTPSVKAIRTIAAKLGVDSIWLETGCRSFTCLYSHGGADWLRIVAADNGIDDLRLPVEIRVTELE